MKVYNVVMMQRYEGLVESKGRRGCILQSPVFMISIVYIKKGENDGNNDENCYYTNNSMEKEMVDICQAEGPMK
jgi:hypothetical protein